MISRKNPDARYRKVAALIRSGIRKEEIERRFQITRRQFTTDLHRARKEGLVPPKPRDMERWTTLEWRLRYRQNTLGSMRAVWQGMDEPQREWLLTQIPPGATLAEFIIAVLRDAYEEERADD